MTMDRANAGTVAVGAEVYTADGDKLGTVKEVAGSCFKVDAKMQTDYWLANVCVASGTASEVRLTFDTARLGDVTVVGPGHTGVHRDDHA